MIDSSLFHTDTRHTDSVFSSLSPRLFSPPSNQPVNRKKSRRAHHTHTYVLAAFYLLLCCVLPTLLLLSLSLSPSNAGRCCLVAGVCCCCCCVTSARLFLFFWSSSSSSCCSLFVFVVLVCVFFCAKSLNIFVCWLPSPLLLSVVCLLFQGYKLLTIGCLLLFSVSSFFSTQMWRTQTQTLHTTRRGSQMVGDEKEPTNFRTFKNQVSPESRVCEFLFTAVSMVVYELLLLL